MQKLTLMAFDSMFQTLFCSRVSRTITDCSTYLSGYSQTSWCWPGLFCHSWGLLLLSGSPYSWSPLSLQFHFWHQPVELAHVPCCKKRGTEWSLFQSTCSGRWHEHESPGSTTKTHPVSRYYTQRMTLPALQSPCRTWCLDQMSFRKVCRPADPAAESALISFGRY